MAGKAAGAGPDPWAKPDWRETVIARSMHSKKFWKTSKGEDKTYVSFRCPKPFMALIDQAAARRGMNRSGYIRRSISAFIASDLGMELSEVAKNFPNTLEADLSHMRSRARSSEPDDGTGYGNWEVVGGTT